MNLALIRPSRPSQEVSDLLTAATRLASEAGLATRVYGTRLVRFPGEAPEQRGADALDPNDAHRLYSSLHEREGLLVLAFGQAYVRRDPSGTPASRRHAITIETFVAHKAVFGLVRGRSDIDRYMDGFREWCAAAPACSGFDDPRTLPLHVFETTRDWSTLGEPDTNASFVAAYGRPGARIDESHKSWVRAAGTHGREVLVIARCELPAGTHWDVTAGRTSALLTSHQVWHMPRGAQGYLNVYPNEYVRRTQASRCKRVFPRH